MRKVLVLIGCLGLLTGISTCGSISANAAVIDTAVSAEVEPHVPAPEPAKTKGGAGIWNADGSFELVSGKLPPGQTLESMAAPGAKTTSSVRLGSAAAGVQSHIGFPLPYSTLRWLDSSNPPAVCVDNQTTRPFGAPEDWWDAADDFSLYQEGVETSTNCVGWYDYEHWDIVYGFDPSRGCTYVYKAWNGSGILTRTIQYMTNNHSPCYNDLQEEYHYVSQGMGLALGNLKFYDGDDPDSYGYNSVMNSFNDDINLYPFHQAPGTYDVLTLDYYN